MADEELMLMLDQLFQAITGTGTVTVITISIITITIIVVIITIFIITITIIVVTIIIIFVIIFTNVTILMFLAPSHGYHTHWP